LAEGVAEGVAVIAEVVVVVVVVGGTRCLSTGMVEAPPLSSSPV
jgi:hypothetical protein